jgi:hypothetical protein
MHRHGKGSSRDSNAQSESRSTSPSSTDISPLYDSDLNAARIETFVNGPVRPEDTLAIENIPAQVSPTSQAADDGLYGGLPVAVATGIDARAGNASDLAEGDAPDVTESEIEEVEGRVSVLVLETASEPGITSTSTPENDWPTRENRANFPNMRSKSEPPPRTPELYAEERSSLRAVGEYASTVDDSPMHKTAEQGSEEGKETRQFEKQGRKTEHNLNNKPDVASYRCETESSRAKKAPLKEKSGGTPVAKPKLVPMKRPEVSPKKVKPPCLFAVPQSPLSDTQEKEEPSTPTIKSKGPRRQKAGGYTKKPTRPRVPSTPANTRQRNGGRNSAREPAPRNTRRSAFDLPMTSRSLWTPKHPIKILKRPANVPEMPSQVDETSASEPPTIVSAQDISSIVRNANSSLHPEAPPFMPNTQQLHTPEGPPSRPDLVSHAAINTTRSRPRWVTGSSSSAPLNRTGFTRPRGGGKSARTPSKATGKK